jgi:gluconokinase
MYIGIDIGTTSTKAIAFNKSGKILAQYHVYYEMAHPQPDWSEQNPDEIVAAVNTAISHVVAHCDTPPLLLSMSAAMHSLILLGTDGNLLTPCIIWADNRASDISTQLKTNSLGNHFYKKTGVPIHPMSPLCKLLWFREHQPMLYQQIGKVVGIKEYVWYRLTGEYCIDTSLASATGLLNIHTLQWDDEILTYLSLSPKQLSTVVAPTYHTTIQLPHQPHTPIPLVIGASDGALATIGTGATHTGSLALTIGTSGAVRTIYNCPYTDPHSRTFCYHINQGQYLVGGASNNGAVILQWLKDNLLQTATSYNDLLALATNIPAGSDKLLFIPYLLGERSPLWNAEARGMLFGMSINHTQAHLIRATLEGIVFCLHSIAKVMMEQQPITSIYASGGFTQNQLWVQIVADVFQLPVYCSDTPEASAMGAVVLGAEALQMPFSNSQFRYQVCHPNSQNATIYKNTFEQWHGFSIHQF